LHRQLKETVAQAAKSWEDEHLPALLADKALAQRVVEQTIPQS
jgi:hypothetical protein